MTKPRSLEPLISAIDVYNDLKGLSQRYPCPDWEEVVNAAHAEFKRQLEQFND